MRLPKWLRRLRPMSFSDEMQLAEPVFTLYQVKDIQSKSYEVGYNDGKREGIALSRKLAQEQLRRILWEQNKNHSTTRTPTQNT